MEHAKIFYSILLFPVLLLTFLLLKTLNKCKPTRKQSPPGPWRLPIIGNMHQLIGSLPHRGLRDLSNKYGPIMSLQLGELKSIVITSPEAAKQVMKTYDLIFADRAFVLAAHILLYGSMDVAFARHGEYWRQMRKICVLELLSHNRVQSFRASRGAEVSQLITRLNDCTGATINLSRMLVSLTNCITFKAAFGMLRDQQDAFVPVVIKIAQALGGFTVADFFPSVKLLHVISGMKAKYEELHKEVDAILENVINEHKTRRRREKSGLDQEKEKDLVDVLLDLQEKGNLEFPITTSNIKAVIMDMFIAGSETSTTVMEWAMSEMIKHPRVMEKAQAEVRQVHGSTKHIDEARLHELKYLNAVIKETLRMHAPGPLLGPRQTTERAEIDGYEIPANTRIIVNAWAIGRDPRFWEEPERFYPERFINNSIDYRGQDFEFIPFGAGRRMCPGISYGMIVVEFTLANLLYHFDWKLPGGANPESLDMTEVFGLSLRRKEELCVVPVARITSSSVL